MKYLKRINESEEFTSDKLYKHVPMNHTIFNDFKDGSLSEKYKLTKKNYRLIMNVINNIFDIDNKDDIYMLSDNENQTDTICFVISNFFISEEYTSNNDLHIIIYEYKEDYFAIEITETSSDSSTFFLCDDIEGIKQFLNSLKAKIVDVSIAMNNEYEKVRNNYKKTVNKLSKKSQKMWEKIENII